MGASLDLDRGPTAAWLLYSLFLILFCLSVRANAAMTDARPGLAANLRTLGLATYPLYLLHTYVGGLAMRFLSGLALPSGLRLAGGFAAAIAAALLVSRFVEPPLRAALRRAIGAVEGRLRSGRGAATNGSFRPGA